MKNIKSLLIITLLSTSMLSVGCQSKSVKEETGDNIFIEEFSESINKRWDKLADITEEYEKGKITESEDLEQTIDCIQEEIDTINENLINIEDKELKELVEKYVKGDEIQIEYLKANNGEIAYKYYEQMQQLRKPTLITLVEEYGVTIDKEYQQQFKEFKEEATIINRENDAKEFLDKLATEVVIEKGTDEWGNKQYVAIIENSSEVDFKTVQFQVNYKDNDGIVVGNDWIYLENFDKNTKQKSTLYPNVEGIENIVLTTDYFEIKE